MPTAGMTERVKTPTLADDPLRAAEPGQMANLEAGTTTVSEIMQQPESSSFKGGPMAHTATLPEQFQQAGAAMDKGNTEATRLSSHLIAQTTKPSSITPVGSGDTSLKPADGSPNPKSSSPTLPGPQSVDKTGIEEGKTSSPPDLQTFLTQASAERLKLNFAHHEHVGPKYSSSY